MEIIRKRQKTGGRQKGTPNVVTRDIRAALRSLAEDNAERVQEWLDRVAENDAAEAMRLWLSLLRYVTPTLAAAAIADVTPPNSMKDIQKLLYQLTDDELDQMIADSPEGKAVLRQRESAPSPGLPITKDDEELLR